MRWSAIAGFVLLLPACNRSHGESTGFPRPPGHVAVTFAVDDTANRVYGGGELAWKGSMRYDPLTRIAETDGTWGGPFAPLYDDGPWTEGGHEGVGEKAGDHVLGTTVFIEPPSGGDLATSFEYGLIDARYDRPSPEGFGNGWLWVGPNGTFAIGRDQTSDVVATGMTLPEFGTIDLRLTLDTAHLEPRGPPDPPWDISAVYSMSSAWGWSAIRLDDDGSKGDLAARDGIYTLVMSAYVGPGRPYNHTGLLLGGQTLDFVWWLGGVPIETGDGYGFWGEAFKTGVTAETRPPAGSWEERPIDLCPAVNKGTINTCIAVP
jgi:hypothetical protein